MLPSTALPALSDRDQVVPPLNGRAATEGTLRRVSIEERKDLRHLVLPKLVRAQGVGDRPVEYGEGETHASGHGRLR